MIKRLWCRLFGHDWHDVDEGLICRRCDYFDCTWDNTTADSFIPEVWGREAWLAQLRLVDYYRGRAVVVKYQESWYTKESESCG